MARRTVLAVTLAAVVAAMIATTGTASAQSCFSTLAKTGVPPGGLVSELATDLAGPGTPGSMTNEAAKGVGLAQQVREDVC